MTREEFEHWVVNDLVLPEWVPLLFRELSWDWRVCRRGRAWAKRARDRNWRWPGQTRCRSLHKEHVAIGIPTL